MEEKPIQEEEYIIGESQEINLSEREGWMGRFFAAFPALRYRNFQLYFGGQLISLIGTWLQTVAQGWLVFILTNSAFWVGVVSALGALPVLIFSLFGGVIVDRFSRKKIIIFTQTSSMVLAFVLGFLTIFKVINVWEISLLSFLLGIVTALDLPARQAFTVEMVGKEDMGSAIALSAGIFNGARVIGPGIAGLLIAAIGTGGAFMVNGISFIAVIIALFFIKVKTVIPKTHPHPVKAIKEGLSYSFANPVIKTLLIFSGITSIFGWSYATIMPVITKDIFHMGASGLGYLYSATGLGALLASVIVSIYSKKTNPLLFIILGNVIFTLALILFTFTTNFVFALVALFAAGVGLITQFSMINTTIQYLVSDDVRGRVMSIYTLMFLGLSPIGSFEIGVVAEHFGSVFAIRAGTLIVFMYGMYVFLSRKRINKEYKSHLQN